MNITKQEILQGSLIASIAHAIMTNVYPDLAYEQSWDGSNYSIVSAGLRGTITFGQTYCVGAIRNEECRFISGAEYANLHLRNCPAEIVRKAKGETFQFLLLENNGKIEPIVTSVFWADDTGIHFGENSKAETERDLVIFEKMFLPVEKAFEAWQEYYEMPVEAIDLLHDLYQAKLKKFTVEVKLSETQKKQIPGLYLNSECISSLKELNFIL